MRFSRPDMADQREERVEDQIQDNAISFMSAQPREALEMKYSQANNAEKHFLRSKVNDVGILEEIKIKSKGSRGIAKASLVTSGLPRLSSNEVSDILYSI
jgi:hypothetical protein